VVTGIATGIAAVPTARTAATAATAAAAPTARKRAREASGRLELGAFALMLTTLTTSGLGIVFWAVAAHLYTPADLGRASAALSSATLLAALAQLNLGNFYARFLPVVTVGRRRMVVLGYAAVALLGAALATVFVAAGLADAVLRSPLDRLALPPAVAVLALFTVQDAVLLGLRAARWVPVENAVFSLLKLVLVALLAGSMPQRGITFAWVAPAAVAVGVITWLLMSRGLRADPAAPSVRLPAPRALGALLAAEYVTGAVAVAVPQTLPLLVVMFLGAKSNAYFALPWLLSSTLGLLVWNVAGPLLVEASADRSAVPALMRRAVRLALLIGGVGALAEIVVAPYLLQVLGGAYAQEGTLLLRLTALAAPLTAVNMAWAMLTRITGRMRRLVLVELCAGAATLGLTALLLPSLGITGAGVAYLSVQALLAAGLAAPLACAVRATRQP
jgi:O-antigen/teichoic acid export membrane protein